MELKTLFKLLWKKRLLLILIPLFTAGVAFAVRLYFSEWKFRSNAMISTGLTVSDELIERGRISPFEVQLAFTNLIEQMKSRVVITQVSYQLLGHDLSDPAPFRKIDPKNNNYAQLMTYSQDKRNEILTHIKNKSEDMSINDPTDPNQKEMDILLQAFGYDFEALLENMTIQRVSNSDYVEVDYVSENPKLSAFVANTLCTEFIRYYGHLRASRSNTSLESLEQILAQRKKYLDEKIEELKQMKSGSDLISSGAESEAKFRQIQDYENQVASAQQSIRQQELTIASLDTRILEAESASSNTTNEQIITLRRKINAMNSRYVNEGQTNKDLLDSITMMRDQLQAFLNQDASSTRITPEQLNQLRERREEAKVTMQVARDNAASLNKILSSLKYSVGHIANTEALMSAQEKEIDVAREEYLSAQGKYNEAREKLVINKMAMSQVLIAEPADSPESKKTLIFMVFSGVVSFALIAFTIIVLELADSRIKTPKQLKRLTKFNVAGAVPLIPKERGDLNWSFFLSNETSESKEFNRLNQELRKIRFEIEARNSKVILITSSQKKQGKTFFIMALANSFSLIRKKTLIIDTNLRNNMLTQLLIARASLKQLLENHGSAVKLLKGSDIPTVVEEKDEMFITKTGNPLVDIIGSKSSQNSPSEIIPETDFQMLLKILADQYDYIILEGASLNEFSDSRELVKYVELVIPVFSADSSVTEDDRDSFSFLHSIKEKLGPAILNRYVPD